MSFRTAPEAVPLLILLVLMMRGINENFGSIEGVDDFSS
jgi:hypothetical protein